jgi:hypothetical protein
MAVRRAGFRRLPSIARDGSIAFMEGANLDETLKPAPVLSWVTNGTILNACIRVMDR